MAAVAGRIAHTDVVNSINLGQKDLRPWHIAQNFMLKRSSVYSLHCRHLSVNCWQHWRLMVDLPVWSFSQNFLSVYKASNVSQMSQVTKIDILLTFY